MVRVRRALKRKLGYRPERKVAVTPAFMLLVKKHLDDGSADGAALWSAMSLAWCALLRNSEYTKRKRQDGGLEDALLQEDIELYRDASGRPLCLIVTIKKSKTDQTGLGHKIAIDATGQPLCAVEAYCQWLQVREEENPTGPAFYIGKGKKGITRAHIATVLKKVARSQNMPTGWVSTHSLRAGAATTLFASGVVSEQLLKAMGRWSSEAYLVYIRTARMKKKAGAAFKALTEIGVSDALAHDETFIFEMRDEEVEECLEECDAET